MDEMGVKILFLLIPGIVALGIVKSVGPRRQRSDFESGLQIFIYGVAAHLIYALIKTFYQYNLISKNRGFLEWYDENFILLSSINQGSSIDSLSIVFSTVVAIVIGFVVSLMQTYTVFHRILRKFNLTKRTGGDIWELVMNAPELKKWVKVRDNANNKAYQGWLVSYSDGSDVREILLKDAVIYKLSDIVLEGVEADGAHAEQWVGESVDVIYLGLDKNNVAIEFYFEDQQENDDQMIASVDGSGDEVQG